MDVDILNYRQLQTEAKKYGIKANQKIDVLRVQLKEEYEKANDKISSVNLNNDEAIFMEYIKETQASTPRHESDNSLIQMDSSTDDLDKIFGTNQRHSQFFDDVIQYPASEEGKSVHKTSNDNHGSLTEKKSESINVETSNDISEKDNSLIVYRDVQEPEINIEVKKHKLNETFEMDENDLQKSQITMEQRRNTLLNYKKEEFKQPLKTANFISKDKCTKISNNINMLKSRVSVTTSTTLKRKSQTNTIDFKKPCSTFVSRVPLNVANVTSRKSISVNKTKSPTIVGRPSYVISKVKPNPRKTFVTSPSQRPTWKK